MGKVQAKSVEAGMIYLHRGTAKLRLKNFYDALEDLNLCLYELKDDHEFSCIAHFRRGVAYFELEEYESAKNSFTGIS